MENRATGTGTAYPESEDGMIRRHVAEKPHGRFTSKDPWSHTLPMERTVPIENTVNAIRMFPQRIGRTGLFLLLIASLVGCAGPEQNAEPPGAIALAPCNLPGIDDSLRCGTYEVWENRTARSGRKIGLRVVVMPATGEAPAPDPLVFFAGGPGGSTVEMAPGIALAMSAARQQRDVLLVDYRGTGESAPLFCPYQLEPRGIDEALETFMPIDQIAACREALGQQADLTQYTTANIVDDIDEVRAALGYQQVNLVGGSYGSRAALAYLARHPESVRTVAIDGIAPIQAPVPAAFARDAQDALDALFAECAADPACHQAFPDPAADFETVLRLASDSAPQVEIVVPETGETRTMTMTHSAVVQTVRYMQYQAFQALQIPAYLRAAAEGDLTPLAITAYNVAKGIMASIPDGLYLSVTCTEDIPFIDTPAAVADAEGTFIGTFRLTQQQEACAQWTRGDIPEGFREPVTADVPVLLVSGERDPVTPPRWGELAAGSLANSRHLVIADGAHGSFGLIGVDCVDALTTTFIEQGSFDGLDFEGCLASIDRPGFLLSTDTPDAIELTADELARFVGTYKAQEGALQATISMDDDRLRMQAFGDDLVLVPTDPLTFLLEGAPPGTYLRFAAANGAIERFEIFQGGNPMLTLLRAE